MSCTKGKIQSNTETFQMPNRQEVAYINLKFPSHARGYMRAVGFYTALQNPAHSKICSSTHPETPSSLHNRPCLQVPAFSPMQPRICKADNPSQATPQMHQAENVLGVHWIAEFNQTHRNYSLYHSDVTRESCLALLTRWLSHKHPQKQRLEAQVSPPQPACLTPRH